MRARGVERGKERGDEIIFLGTGGARIVVFKQIRASGGIWLSLGGTNILLDPGPGCLVRCTQKRLSLDPTKLDGIILSHKHLDHSGDVNVMIEAMTEGGFKKKGILFAPEDALFSDPVVLKYLHDYVSEVQTLREGDSYKLGKVEFSTPLRHIHGNALTFVFNFHTSSHSLSYISDTRFFPELLRIYRGDILIINVVRFKPSNLDHLCIEDVEKILEAVHPRICILTHFGMTLLRANPMEVARQLEKAAQIRVIAANDGMRLALEELV